MQVSNYALIRVLGEGGMGQVWLAQHVHLGTPAVVKSLHPHYAQQESLRQRFLTEARLLAQLSHPAIVRLYDFTIQDGIPYLIMEYVQGQGLDAFIRTHGALSPDRVSHLLAPVLDALAYLHAHKVIHRDIKPSNLIVLPDGTAKLIDFGIAKALDEDLKLTGTGMQVGTALYMAPEQIRGEPVSPQTDLYAMGLVIYECLFGHFPWEWEGLTAFLLYQRLLNEPPAIPTETPEAWKAFFERALAKAPAERFPSAEAMKAALSSLTTENATASPPAPLIAPNPSPAPASGNPPSLRPTPPPSRRKKTWLTIAGIGIFATGSLFLLMFLLVRSRTTVAETEYDPDFSFTEPSRDRQPSDWSDAVYPELRRYLASYEPPEGIEIRWGEVPRIPLYEMGGTIPIPVEMLYTYQKEESDDDYEPCYLSGIPIGVPQGRRRITTIYNVTYECVQSDFAHVSYSIGASMIFFSVTLPERRYQGCTEVARDPLKREIGGCE